MSTFVVGVTVVAVVVVFTARTNAHLSPYRCALCVCCHFLDACLHVVCFLFCICMSLPLRYVCAGAGGGKEVLQRKLSEVVCYTCISPAVAVVVGIFTTIGHVTLKIE